MRYESGLGGRSGSLAPLASPFSPCYASPSPASSSVSPCSCWGFCPKSLILIQIPRLLLHKLEWVPFPGKIILMPMGVKWEWIWWTQSRYISEVILQTFTLQKWSRHGSCCSCCSTETERRRCQVEGHSQGTKFSHLYMFLNSLMI